jgi:DNA-binding GntR family transcriptional regulator
MAADQIEAAIVSCELPPGAVIVEAELSEWLGLGRTPVREALVSLANANLLRLGRGGVVIPELNAMTMLKLLELREPIERLCIQKAVDRQTEDDREAFKELQSRLKQIPNDDRPAFMAVLWDTHKAVATASQNEFIHTALRTTQGLSRRYWGHFAGSSDQELAKAIYLSLLEAMLARDANAALGQSQRLTGYLREFTLESMQKLAGRDK